MYNGTTYIIHWMTGDKDTCYGRSDLNDLLKETNCTIDGWHVMDGDRKVGRLEISNP